MRPAPVAELQIASYRGAGFGDAGVGPEIDFLVFDRAPQPLDEDVVAPGALAVHADGDARVLERLDDVDRGELAALGRC